MTCGIVGVDMWWRVDVTDGDCDVLKVTRLVFTMPTSLLVDRHLSFVVDEEWTGSTPRVYTCDGGQQALYPRHASSINSWFDVCTRNPCRLVSSRRAKLTCSSCKVVVDGTRENQPSLWVARNVVGVVAE